MNDTLLQAEHVGHRYDDGTLALRGVNLWLRAGEKVGLIGPSGSGKSTLLLRLAGLLHGTGRVLWEDRELDHGSAGPMGGRIGIVFQSADDQLFMPTLADDLAFGPINQGLTEAEVGQRVRQAADAFGLDGLLDRAPHHLSMGQKRAAAIAAVLAMQPALLLMDEPSSNMDPRARRVLIDLLAGLNMTLLIASHDLTLVGRVCQRVIVLDQGLAVAEGPAEQILADTALLEAHGLV